MRKVFGLLISIKGCFYHLNTVHLPESSGFGLEAMDCDWEITFPDLRWFILFLLSLLLIMLIDIDAILSTTTKHGVEQLVHPADKQNVSLATDLLIAFSTAVKGNEIAKLGFRIVGVIPVLRLLGMVMDVGSIEL